MRDHAGKPDDVVEASFGRSRSEPAAFGSIADNEKAGAGLPAMHFLERLNQERESLETSERPDETNDKATLQTERLSQGQVSRTRDKDLGIDAIRHDDDLGGIDAALDDRVTDAAGDRNDQVRPSHDSQLEPPHHLVSERGRRPAFLDDSALSPERAQLVDEGNAQLCRRVLGSKTVGIGRVSVDDVGAFAPGNIRNELPVAAQHVRPRPVRGESPLGLGRPRDVIAAMVPNPVDLIRPPTVRAFEKRRCDDDRVEAQLALVLHDVAAANGVSDQLRS